MLNQSAGNILTLVSLNLSFSACLCIVLLGIEPILELITGFCFFFYHVQGKKKAKDLLELAEESNLTPPTQC